MSLVNDMLRDLDQRRKESEGPAARIRLTPAGDYPRRESRNWIPYIGIGLVMVAIGLGYIWVDMNRSTSSTQLAEAVIPPSAVASIPVEQNEPNEQIQQVQQNEQEPVAVAATTVAIAQPAAAIESDTAPAAVNSGNDTQTRIETLVVSTEPAADSAASNLASAAEPGSLNGAANTSLAAAPITQYPAATTLEPIPSIVIPEQIKGVTALSLEQRDTIAVQEALMLIENNQPTAAFAKLEQQLLDNPFAHQSRETYAKFLMNQGDVASADALMDSGLELAPNHSGFKKVKARLLIEKGDIQTAVMLLASRAPVVANDLEYHEILASAQLASRDFDGAILSYTGLVQQDQTQGRWWYGFAAAQDAMGNTTAAQQAYSRALEKPNLSTNLRRRSQDRLTALSR